MANFSEWPLCKAQKMTWRISPSCSRCRHVPATCVTVPAKVLRRERYTRGADAPAGVKRVRQPAGRVSELLLGHVGCRAWDAEGGCGSRSRPDPGPGNPDMLGEGGRGVRREARGQGVGVLRVQHLPGPGARSRGDAMRSSVLLAVHLQVRHATVASPSPSPAAIFRLSTTEPHPSEPP